MGGEGGWIGEGLVSERQSVRAACVRLRFYVCIRVRVFAERAFACACAC